MGRIKTRFFYTDLVEHYFRMAVRYETVSKASSQHWFDTTKNWIDKLSDLYLISNFSAPQRGYIAIRVPMICISSVFV